MRRSGRYVSPSRRRRRRSIILLSSSALVIAALVTAPLISRAFGLKNDLNVLRMISDAIGTDKGSGSEDVRTTENAVITRSADAFALSSPSPTPVPTQEAIPVNLGVKQSYNFDINFTSLTKMECNQHVTYSNPTNKALDEIVFALPANVTLLKDNAQGEGIALTNVVVDGVNADFVIQGQQKNGLSISLPTPLEPGKSVRITFAYTLDAPSGGARIGTNDRTAHFSYFYPVAAEYAQEWLYEPLENLPCYTAIADYTAIVRVPKDCEVASSGTSVDVQRLDSGNVYQIVANDARDFAVCVGSDMRIIEQTFDGVNLRACTYHTASAEYIMSREPAIISYYAKVLGELKSKKIEIVESRVSGGVFTSTGLIAIDTSIVDGQRLELLYRMAYSSAKLWFGGEIGGSDQLLEALSEYMAIEFMTQREGASSDDRGFAISRSKGGKGLEDLKEQVGDEAFTAALNSFLSVCYGGHSDPETFISALPIEAQQAARAIAQGA